MRIVMMGTGGFAVPTFRALVSSRHDVVALFTRPTRAPARRRARPPRNPMREAAEELGVADVRDPESINSEKAKAELAEIGADLFVVCDYGQILAKSVLELATLGGINLHASLLPLYRGAAPINWAVYDGQTKTGVTVIHMTPKLDAGPSLRQVAVDIGDDEDAIVLEERLAELGAPTVLEAIELLAGWDRTCPIGEKQDSDRTTKAPRLKKSDGLIDWSRTAQQIFDHVRAFKPWPGTYTFCYRGDHPPLRLQVNKVSLVEGPCGEPGQYVADRKLRISTGEGVLQLDEVRPEGRKLVTGADFLLGQPMKPGDYMAAPSGQA